MVKILLYGETVAFRLLDDIKTQETIVDTRTKGNFNQFLFLAISLKNTGNYLTSKYEKCKLFRVLHINKFKRNKHTRANTYTLNTETNSNHFIVKQLFFRDMKLQNPNSQGSIQTLKY